MIRLDKIKKTYIVGEKKVVALGGVSVDFRESEFVCILGPSGCGKTTLLNIIGGLDKYTSGDLLIDGKSTSSFTDRDWDTYRSSEVGFVFQSYNLINHLTVLENVETALAINGISKEERKKRAIAALVKVGLSEHLRKKPRQLSGGEMQRVAIARAIVNDPSVILADEPTGALDSENSVRIMDLLKEISKERLVVTVTHNDQLAERYATRIIRISDGKIVSDSNPCRNRNEQKKADKSGKSFMSYPLALSLSFGNLMSKKMRTALTAVASAIAIVGISLVIACSNGLNAFIDKIQKDTMSGTPVTVSRRATDYAPYITSLLGYFSQGENKYPDAPTNSIVVNHLLADAVQTEVVNDITDEYLAYVAEIDSSRVVYDLGYSVSKMVYKSINVRFSEISKTRSLNLLCSTADNWIQIPSDRSLVYEQYDVIGKFPTEANELALVVDKNSSVSDTVLTAFFVDVFSQDRDYYTYDEILSDESPYGVFNLLAPDDYFVDIDPDDGKNLYEEKKTAVSDYLIKYYDSDLSPAAKTVRRSVYEREFSKVVGDYADSVYCYDLSPFSEAVGTPLKITGIFRLKEDTQYGMFSASPVCYTRALAEKVVADAAASEVVNSQKKSPSKRVVASYDEDGNAVYDAIDGDVALSVELAGLGYDARPSEIKFYPKTIGDKDYLLSYLDAYNVGKEDGEKVRYVDNVGVAIEIVRSIVSGVSAVLITLTSVSLVVAAIMIAVLTYVSVMERTKEIGILRAVGARKKDVVRLFMTETGMIGLIAGAIGIVGELVFSLPLNGILKFVTGVSGFMFLNALDVPVIIAVSVVLTVLAGLVPSVMAGRKDPVLALRSE